MATHRASFDNGATLTGTMTMGLTGPAGRNVISWDGTFSTFDANAPRYDLDTVGIAPPPVLETIATLPFGSQELAGGIGVNGESLAVFFVSNGAGSRNIRIYQDGPTPTLLRTISPVGDGITKPNTRDDILPTLNADIMYSPRMLAMADGLMVIQCETFRYIGTGARTTASNWRVYGVALVYSIDNGATWALAWDGGEEPLSEFAAGGAGNYVGQYGREWSLYMGPGVTADDIWVGVASYASATVTARNGWGSGFSSRFRRVNGVWETPGAVRVLLPRQDGMAHMHMWYPRRQNGTIYFIGHQGDNVTNNVTVRFTYAPTELDDIDDYLDGLVAKSGAVDVWDWASGDPGNWTLATISGEVGPTAGVSRSADQHVSFAPAFSPSEGISGPDENATFPLTRIQTAFSDEADAPAIRRVYGHPFAAWGNSHRAFGVNTDNALATNPAVLANLAPGATIVAGNADLSVVVYKPAGAEHFAPVASIQNEATIGPAVRPIITPAGYAWYIIRSTLALMRFKLPASIRTEKPLCVGPGGTNYARTLVTQANAPSAGNTLNYNATDSPVAFPGTGNVWKLDTGTTGGGLGSQRLAWDTIPTDCTWMQVQMLLYVPPYDAVNFPKSKNNMPISFQMYTVEGGTGSPTVTGATTTFKDERRIETPGNFVLWTINLRNAPTGADWNLSIFPPTIQPVIQMRMQTSFYHPNLWWMKVLNVLVDAPTLPDYDIPTNGVSGTQTIADEALTLGGFTCGSAWTFEGLLTTSKRGDDHLSARSGTYRTLMTLRQASGVEVRIEHDASSKVRITTVNGADTDALEFTGLPLARRGDPIHIGISCDGTDYTVVLSYRNCAIRTGSITSADAIVAPTQILAGSTGIAIHTVRVTDDAALDAAAMTTNLLANLTELSQSGTRGRARGRGRRSNVRLSSQ